MKRALPAAAAALALALAAALTATPGAAEPAQAAAAPEPLVVGLVLPMTGPGAGFGAEVAAGVTLAVDAANATGGVRGHRLTVEVVDSGAGVGGAAAELGALLDRHPVVVIGEVGSAQTLALAALTTAAGVPLLAPTATAPDVAAAGPRVFMVAATDEVQGRVAARWALRRGWKRAAVLADAAAPYARGLAQAFAAELVRGGGGVVAAPSYQAGDDPAAALDAVRAARPQVVFAPGSYVEGARLLRAARAAGLRQPFLGGDGWDSASLAAAAGAAAEGALYVNHFAPDARGRVVRAFARAYRTRHKAAPSALAALGHDAAALAIDALGRATSLDGADVAAALAASAPAERSTGRFAFDADRRAARAMVIVRVAKGKVEHVATVDAGP